MMYFTKTQYLSLLFLCMSVVHTTAYSGNCVKKNAKSYCVQWPHCSWDMSDNQCKDLDWLDCSVVTQGYCNFYEHDCDWIGGVGGGVGQCKNIHPKPTPTPKSCADHDSLVSCSTNVDTCTWHPYLTDFPISGMCLDKTDTDNYKMVVDTEKPSIGDYTTISSSVTYVDRVPTDKVSIVLDHAFIESIVLDDQNHVVVHQHSTASMTQDQLSSLDGPCTNAIDGNWELDETTGDAWIVPIPRSGSTDASDFEFIMYVDLARIQSCQSSSILSSVEDTHDIQAYFTIAIYSPLASDGNTMQLDFGYTPYTFLVRFELIPEPDNPILSNFTSSSDIVAEVKTRFAIQTTDGCTGNDGPYYKVHTTLALTYSLPITVMKTSMVVIILLYPMFQLIIMKELALWMN